MPHPPVLDRRSFLLSTAPLALLQAGCAAPRAGTAIREINLVAAPAQVHVRGAAHPAVNAWAYGGAVPGPQIRARQGERLRVVLENRLPQETTVHWHGVRVPNAMDGVPHLTQPPVPPGGRFVYEFRFDGGIMGGLRRALLDGRPTDRMSLLRAGKAWALNGVVANEHRIEPMLTLSRGSSQVFRMRNTRAGSIRSTCTATPSAYSPATASLRGTASGRTRC